MASTAEEIGRHLGPHEIDELFIPTMNKFLDSIPLEDRSEIQSFRSKEQVKKHVEALFADESKVPSLPKAIETFIRAISVFSKSLEPYFSAINNYSQAKPEVLGLIWGTVQFVFKLCSNYDSFLHKLSDLFFSLTEDLGRYEQHAASIIEMCRSLRSSTYDKCTRVMAEGMALLYADLLELLRAICHLFRKNKNHRLKDALRIGKMFWVPFDDQFGDFRRRFEAHKSLLEFYGKKESTKIHTEWFELLKQQNQGQLNHLAMIQDTLKRERFARLKNWLEPDKWTLAFESSKRRRHPNTSSWILDHPRYQMWARSCEHEVQEGDPSSGVRSYFPRTLAIQAKPGYGKSVICGLIIENLLCDHTLQGSKTIRSVAYYFFDKQTASQHHDTVAFRAIITQLLHQNRENPELMDPAFFLMDTSGSGQTSASVEEVEDLMSLLLRSIKDPTLVLDGLDECNDPNSFLKDLKAICSSTKTKVLLSSRPNIDYTTYFGDTVENLLLDEEANLGDIKRFLLPEIDRLIRSELLMPDDSAENIASLIAKKSRSMFLWASLLMEHLNSEMMTPEDRLEAIDEMSLFPELDSLYARILSKLHSLNKGKAAQRNLKRLFEWLCVTARPLTATELRSALAIQAGSATKAGRKIAHFEKSVVRMTGSLVEVADDYTVRFIHTSVLEFFTGAMEESETSSLKDHRFRISVEAVNFGVAADCLSYLIHDSPRQRLSSIFSKVTTPMIVAKYHLLPYASQFWAFHTFKALESWTPSSNTLLAKKDPSAFTTIHLLDGFLRDPLAITTWTEAYWTFGLPPTLGELPSVASKLCILRDVSTGKMLEDFATDLEEMNTQWSHVLAPNPWEIWEPSISAFLRSPFWVQTKEITITALGHSTRSHASTCLDEPNKPVTIMSACSEDGLEVGTITVRPSKLYRAETAVEVPNLSRLERLVGKLSSDWEVTYEITTLKTQAVVFNAHFELSPSQVGQMLRKSFASLEPKKFAFPTSISADLRQFAILRCVIRVSLPQWNEGKLVSEGSCQFQNLEYSELSNSGSCSLYEHTASPSISQCPCTYDSFRIVFSPESRHLVVLQVPEQPSLFSRLDFMVYKDYSQEGCQPNFVEVGRTLSKLSDGHRTFAFHPTLPILAISQMAVTVLWFFEEDEGKRQTTLLTNPLNGLSFSDCGSYIHGERIGGRGDYVILPIRHLIHHQEAVEPLVKPSTQGRNQIAVKGQVPVQLLATTEGPRVLSTGAVVFSKQHSSSQVSVVRQFGASGELVLYKATNDGHFTSECVMRLPKSANTGVEATFLNPFDGGRTAQVILNKTPQNSYSVEESEKSGLELPLLINRTQESIPRRVEKRELGSADFHTFSKRVCF